MSTADYLEQKINELLNSDDRHDEIPTKETIFKFLNFYEEIKRHEFPQPRVSFYCKQLVIRHTNGEKDLTLWFGGTKNSIYYKSSNHDYGTIYVVNSTIYQGFLEWLIS